MRPVPTSRRPADVGSEFRQPAPAEPAADTPASPVGHPRPQSTASVEAVLPTTIGLPLPGMPGPGQLLSPRLDQVPGQALGQIPAQVLISGAPPADAGRMAPAEEQAHLAALAAHCVGGDHTAWESLVRREQRRVYGLCYRFTGSRADAEDLTQEVFLKVYRNLQSFDPARASFGVWLTALTRNLLVDHYRRSRLERSSESLDEPFGDEGEGQSRAERLPDARAGQEQHVAGLELRARVQAALARVTPELREAVILRDLQDLDYREIAEVLGVPQGTVKSRISRGRAELARLLGKPEERVA